MGQKTFQDGMEILKSDLNDLQKLAQQDLLDRLFFELVQRQEDIFFENGFKVNFVDGDTIKTLKGLGIQNDATQTGVEPKHRLLPLANDTNQDITAPDGANPRIDVVSVKHKKTVTKTESRRFKDSLDPFPITNENLDVEEDWDLDITITPGTPNAVPVAPATPAGSIKIAELLVSAVSGIADQNAITDTRSKVPLGAGILIDTSAYVRVTQSLNTALSTVLSELDAFIKVGKPDRNDHNELGADPGTPAAGIVSYFSRNNKRPFMKDSTGKRLPMFFDDIYDLIVSDGPMATHSDLQTALGVAVDGDRIFVEKNQSIASGAIPTIANLNIEIKFKAGTTFSKNTAGTGLIIGPGGTGAKIYGGRFTGFGGGGEEGISIDNAADFVMIRDTRFQGNTTDIDPGTSNTESIIGTITE